MKTPALILGSIFLAGLCSSAAQADSSRPGLRHSFQSEVTRSTASGRSLTRATEQVASQNQFQRQSQWTTGQGNSASREVKGQLDAENQSYHRSLEGTRFNGDTYSANRETIKTDSGYQRNLSRTNEAGESTTANVSVVRDRENKSVTKEAQATGLNGQTYGKTVTRSYGESGS